MRNLSSRLVCGKAVHMSTAPYSHLRRNRSALRSRKAHFRLQHPPQRRKDLLHPQPGTGSMDRPPAILAFSSLPGHFCRTRSHCGSSGDKTVPGKNHLSIFAGHYFYCFLQIDHIACLLDTTAQCQSWNSPSSKNVPSSFFIQNLSIHQNRMQMLINDSNVISSLYSAYLLLSFLSKMCRFRKLKWIGA